MSDDLRDQLAIAAQAHVYRLKWPSGTAECACGEKFRSQEWGEVDADLEWQWAQHLADNLIAAGVTYFEPNLGKPQQQGSDT